MHILIHRVALDQHALHVYICSKLEKLHVHVSCQPHTADVSHSLHTQ